MFSEMDEVIWNTVDSFVNKCFPYDDEFGYGESNVFNAFYNQFKFGDDPKSKDIFYDEFVHCSNLSQPLYDYRNQLIDAFKLAIALRVNADYSDICVDPEKFINEMNESQKYIYWMTCDWLYCLQLELESLLKDYPGNGTKLNQAIREDIKRYFVQILSHISKEQHYSEDDCGLRPANDVAKYKPYFEQIRKQAYDREKVVSKLEFFGVIFPETKKEKPTEALHDQRGGADYGITLVDTVVNSLIKKLPELPYNLVPEDWDKRQEYLKAQLINYWFTKLDNRYWADGEMPSSIIKEYEPIEHYIERSKTIVIVGVFEYLTKSNREMFTIGRINLSDFYSLNLDLVGYEVELLISLMDKFHNEICYIDKELEKCSKKKSSEFVASARNVCLEFINSLEF